MISLHKKKERLDKLLIDLDLAPTRNKAQALILSGQVLVNGQSIDKPGTLINPNLSIKLKNISNPYVSRGGLKLESALNQFQINPTGMICLDVGASTGGFTDCLLQHGANKVYSVDVGYGQLDQKLRRHSRVIVKEKTNFRFIQKQDIPEQIDLAVIDVSFISLKLIIPILTIFLNQNAQIIALIKPQFEAGPKNVTKGGVVKNPEIRKFIVSDIAEFFKSIGLIIYGQMESPLKGPAGNIEYFIWAKNL